VVIAMVFSLLLLPSLMRFTWKRPTRAAVTTESLEPRRLERVA